VAFAVACGAPQDVQAAVALAVTEAATNAVVHAYLGMEPGQLRVTGEPLQDALVVRVIDDGRGMQPRHDSPGLGLGLPTIGKLCAHLDIADGPGGHGTEVRMVFAAPGVAGPAVAPPADDVQELLEDVARLAEGAWPQEGVAALVDLVVPRWADVCLVDVLGEDGVPRRLAPASPTDRGRIDRQASAILAGHRTAPIPPCRPPRPSPRAARRSSSSTIGCSSRSPGRRGRPSWPALADAVVDQRPAPGVRPRGGQHRVRLRAERKDRDRLIALFELLTERAARGWPTPGCSASCAAPTAGSSGSWRRSRRP
jgi:anti-sigma regulatory factor (Ser/Thr protein kinase)